MARRVDIDALRLKAQGADTDVLTVSKRWLKAIIADLEDARPVPDLDLPAVGGIVRINNVAHP